MKIVLCKVSLSINKLQQLDPAAGNIDINKFKAASIDVTSLTPEQKKSAGDSLESCIESDFTLPPPPPFALTSKFEELDKKYTKRNNPSRAIVCAVKALLTNVSQG